MTLSPPQLFPTALVVTATLVAWLAAPAPAPVRTSGAAIAEPWEMVKIRTREPARWIETIDGHKLWGESAESAPSASANGQASGKRDWQVVGVAIQGGLVSAFISIGEEPSKPYRAGDETPDGAKILKIEEDRLYLLANGKESILKIYRK